MLVFCTLGSRPTHRKPAVRASTRESVPYSLRVRALGRRGRQRAVLPDEPEQLVQLRVAQRGGARAEAAAVVRVGVGLW